MKKFIALAAALAVLAIAPPASAVRGDPSEWGTYTPVRWDPCTTITWSTPHDGSVMEQSFTKAVRKAARFSGLTFQRVDSGGMVTAVARPSAEFGGYGGRGGFINTYTDSNGETWGLSALITISAEMLVPEWDRFVPALFLHEMGHVMGLDHVTSTDEVMSSGSYRRRYGAGDRAGLAAMHVDHCASSPAVPNTRTDLALVS